MSDPVQSDDAMLEEVLAVNSLTIFPSASVLQRSAATCTLFTLIKLDQEEDG